MKDMFYLFLVFDGYINDWTLSHICWSSQQHVWLKKCWVNTFMIVVGAFFEAYTNLVIRAESCILLYYKNMVSKGKHNEIGPTRACSIKWATMAYTKHNWKHSLVDILLWNVYILLSNNIHTLHNYMNVHLRNQFINFTEISMCKTNQRNKKWWPLNLMLATCYNH